MTSNFAVHQQPAVTNTMHSQSNHTSTSKAPPQYRFQLMVDLRRIFTQTTLKIDNLPIKNFLRKNLLDINFDYKLNFTNCIEGACQKASRKLNAFAGLAPYMTSSKKHILTNDFPKSQFNYCPLIWMYYTRSSNNKTSRLYEGCLRLVYRDKKSNFEKIITIGFLAIEIFKFLKGIDKV